MLVDIYRLTDTCSSLSLYDETHHFFFYLDTQDVDVH